MSHFHSTELDEFNFQVVVIFLQLPAFTTQEDSCKKATVQDAMMKLNSDGGGPLGPFNKHYMAYTWTDVLKNFNNLITRKHGNLSATQPNSAGVFPITLVVGPCTTNQGKYLQCSACPAITDLGPDKFPRYINEIVCRNESTICGPQANGLCKTSGLNQEFLAASCGSSGKEVFETYTQFIRSCCDCFQF